MCHTIEHKKTPFPTLQTKLFLWKAESFCGLKLLSKEVSYNHIYYERWWERVGWVTVFLPRNDVPGEI